MPSVLEIICRIFRNQWESGIDPSIESFLRNAPNDDGSLLRGLLAIERVERLKRGESPTLRDYESRFHDQPHLVREVFGATPIFSDVGNSKDAVAATIAMLGSVDTLTDTMPNIPGYIIHDVLGVGGMGLVYRATQTAAHREVALKVIRPDLLTSMDESRRAVAIDRARRGAMITIVSSLCMT